MRHDRGQTESGGTKSRGHLVFRWAMLSAVFILPVLFTASCKGNQPYLTLTPTPLSSAIVSPLPTQTPAISPTPTSTPVKILQTYDLPAWMSNPNTVILADLIIKEAEHTTSYKLSFLNASTGEWYDLQVPSDARKYFWYDNMHFGFLTNDLQRMYMIDTSNGQVATIAVSEQETHILNLPSNINALQVRQESSNSGIFVFDDVFGLSSWYFSKSVRYSAELDLSAPGHPITVTDNDTDQIVWQSSQFDGIWESEFAWSPVEDSYLAIVRGTFDEQYLYPGILKNTFLEIIDVSTGKRITSFKGDIGNLHWSPDGRQILYQDAKSRRGTIGYAFQGAPCIFNIQSSQNQCLTSIPLTNIPIGYQLGTTGLYSWSPDGKSIRYIYLYSNYQTHEQAGNVCIYNLINGNIACPTEKLVGPNGWGISDYDFSPDGQFIHLCYSESSILNDYIGFGNDALININGTGLIKWVNENEDGGPGCSYQTIWRPLP